MGDADKDGVREVGISVDYREVNGTLTGEGPVGIHDTVVDAVRDFFTW